MIFEIVAKVLGATELNESAFSSDSLTVTLEHTANGKIKATVTPADSPPRSSYA